MRPCARRSSDRSSLKHRMRSAKHLHSWTIQCSPGVCGRKNQGCHDITSTGLPPSIYAAGRQAVMGRDSPLELSVGIGQNTLTGCLHDQGKQSKLESQNRHSIPYSNIFTLLYITSVNTFTHFEAADKLHDDTSSIIPGLMLGASEHCFIPVKCSDIRMKQSDGLKLAHHRCHHHSPSNFARVCSLSLSVRSCLPDRFVPQTLDI